MFKKATFALAGVLGMVAAAALSTTAGAADTDAALVTNVKFFENQNFNPGGTGAAGEATATTQCKTVAVDPGPATFTEARSAKLLDSTLTVALFSDDACTTPATVLNSSNQEDAGLTWLLAVKSYKLV